MRVTFLVILSLLLPATLVLAKKDYYEVLGVDRRASKREIKASYKKLSKIHHPDKNNGQQDVFIELSNAYEVLADDEKRRIYDTYGEEGLTQGQNGGGFHDPFDIFERFGFGGGGANRNSQKKGPKIELELQVTLEELFMGKSFDIELNKQVICSTCRGTGAKNPNDVQTCTSCNGRGIKIVRQMLAPGMYQTMQSHCDKCDGKGKVVKVACPVCRGKKVKRGGNEVTVTIEKGMKQGQQIVLEREGDQDPEITAGDVIFTIHTLPHPLFTRQGDNLHIKQIITLRQALLGFKKKIIHLDGSDLIIEKSTVTQSGFIQMINGQGMPTHEFSSERGHLFIEYQVIFPEHLDYIQHIDVIDKLFKFPGNSRDEL